MIKEIKTAKAKHVACVGERTSVYRVLMRKPEGKRPLGRPRRRREDNVKMGNQERGRRYGLDSSGSRYGQVGGGLVNTVMKRAGAYRVLMRKPERKRPLGRPRRRREDNIKMGNQERGRRNGLDSSGSRYGQVEGGALVNTVMNF